MAQDHESHRLLAAPDENGLTNSRLELFRRLQGLIDQADLQANSPTAQPLDPATFEALQQALRDFPFDPSPSENSTDPNTRSLSPPGQLDPVRPGQLQPGEIQPPGPPSPSNRKTPPNGQRPAPQPPRGLLPTPPPSNPNGQQTPRPPLSDADRKLLDALIRDLANGNSNTPNGVGPNRNPQNNGRNNGPNQRPSTTPGNEGPQPLLPQLPPDDRPFQPNENPIITNENQLPRPQNETTPNGQSPNAQNPNGQLPQPAPQPSPQTLQEQVRVLNEAMDRLRREQQTNGADLLPEPANRIPNGNRTIDRNNVSPNPQPIPNGQDQLPNGQTTPNPNPIPQANRNNTSDPSNRANNPNAANDPNNLSNMSLDDRMLTILERARRRVHEDAEADRNGESAQTGNAPASESGVPSDDNKKPGWENALSGVVQRAAERAARQAEPEQQPWQRRSNRPEPRSNWQPESDDSDSWFSRSTAAADNMFMNLTNGESQTRTSNSGPSFGSSGGSFPFVPVLLIAGVAGLAFWMLRRTEQARQLAAARSVDHPPMPSSVRTREDVVQAFHAIASRTPQVASSSWTHREAAEALIQAKPANEFDVEVLADVYEHARYQPKEAEFGDEQIVKARRAVERWEL